MNNLLGLIYLTAMGVFLVLRRQERSQKREIEFEYNHLGLSAPPRRPKIQPLEAILNVAIGFMLTAFGIFGAYLMAHVPDSNPADATGTRTLFSVSLAGGLTLIVLGVQAFRQNVSYRKIEGESGHPGGSGRSNRQ